MYVYVRAGGGTTISDWQRSKATQAKPEMDLNVVEAKKKEKRRKISGKASKNAKVCK